MSLVHRAPSQGNGSAFECFGCNFCATTRETCRTPSDRPCCGNAGRTIPFAHSMSQFGSNKQVQDGLKKGGPAAGPRADGQASNANFKQSAYPQPAPKARSATIPPQLSGVSFVQLMRARKHDHPIIELSNLRMVVTHCVRSGLRARTRVKVETQTPTLARSQVIPSPRVRQHPLSFNI